MDGEQLRSALERVGVVPVLRVDRVERSAGLVKVLYDAGLDVLEVTLRTPSAIHVIAAMKAAIPQALIGAGTVLTADDARMAIDAGAAFLVSPGISCAVVRVSRDSGIPTMPGVATATEISWALGEDISLLKFFPAAVAGGLSWITAMAAPFPTIRFVPTGGVGIQDLPAYLGHPAIAAVGGSWIAPSSLVEAGDFARIGEVAREAVGVVRSLRRGEERVG